MKCYFCEKEFESNKRTKQTITFMGKEVSICKECIKLYQQMESNKLTNKDALLYFSARLTDDTTDSEVLEAMDKYVAEALEANDIYFQERVAKGFIEKQELWKCYKCGAYNLKDEKYCMTCYTESVGWDQINEGNKLTFYTSPTNAKMETNQAFELSTFSRNLVWLIPLGILCIFLTGQVLALTVIIGFTVWGLLGQKNYDEYYTVGKDSRIRNDLRFHIVNAKKTKKENQGKLKFAIKQNEFLDRAHLLRHLIQTEYEKEAEKLEGKYKNKFEVPLSKSLIIHNKYKEQWETLNEYLAEEKEMVAVKYPFNEYNAPIRNYESQPSFPGMCTYCWKPYTKSVTEEQYKKAEIELKRILKGKGKHV